MIKKEMRIVLAEGEREKREESVRRESGEGGMCLPDDQESAAL